MITITGGKSKRRDVSSVKLGKRLGEQPQGEREDELRDAEDPYDPRDESDLEE